MPCGIEPHRSRPFELLHKRRSVLDKRFWNSCLFSSHGDRTAARLRSTVKPGKCPARCRKNVVRMSIAFSCKALFVLVFSIHLLPQNLCHASIRSSPAFHALPAAFYLKRLAYDTIGPLPLLIPRTRAYHEKSLRKASQEFGNNNPRENIDATPASQDNPVGVKLPQGSKHGSESSDVKPLGLDWQKAISLLVEAQESGGIDAATAVYNAALNAYERNGDGETAMKVFHEMTENKIYPDLITYHAVMSACEKAYMSRTVLQLFESLKESGLHPDVTAYGILLSALEKLGMAHGAIEAFEEMRKDILIERIPYSAYANVVLACAKSCFAVEALKYYHEMRSRGFGTNLCITNQLLIACDLAGLWNESNSIFNDLISDEDNSPDLNTFNIVLGISARLKDKKRLEKTWKAMLAAVPHVLPNEVSYMHCIEGYSNCGQWRKAIEILNELESSVFALKNPRAYLMVLYSCKECGEWLPALRVLRRMLTRVKGVTTEAYNCAIGACINAGKWHESLAIYSELLTLRAEKLGVRPDSLTLSYAIVAFHNLNMHSEVKELLNMAEKKGIVFFPLGERFLSACEMAKSQ